MDVFKEILPAILQTKSPSRLNPDESGYNSFLVNRALSYHVDCIMAANAMNCVHSVDKHLQYDYFINSIRSKKRQFKKWHKRNKEEDLSAIQEYYGYSRIRAEEAISLLSDDQIDEIRRRTSKGGLDDKRIRKPRRDKSL